MKKYRSILIAIIFFLLHTSSFFWYSWNFWIAIALYLLLYGLFFLVLFLVFYEINLSYKEKLKNKLRLLTLSVLIGVIIQFKFFPNVVDIDAKMNGKRIFHAYYEGSANCTISLILRKKSRFTYRSVCFGVTEKNGDYRIANDTIFLKYDDNSDMDPDTSAIYGVLKYKKNKQNYKILEVFKEDNDKPLSMKITQNELK